MKVSTLFTTVLFLSGGVFASSSMAVDCEAVYFSADDPNHQSPRKTPAPEFLQTLNLAQAGDAEAQSEVAVSYDVGYLVAPCAKKAKYWYQKAAAQGNGLARDALRRDIVKAERNNREFIRVDQIASPHSRAEAVTMGAGNASSTDTPAPKRVAYQCTTSQGSVFYRSNPCPKRDYDTVSVNSNTGGAGGSAQVSGPVEQVILDRDVACKLAKEKRSRQQKIYEDRGRDMPEQFRQEVEKNVAEICRG